MTEQRKPRFHHAPWKVEEGPGEIFVVDARGNIVTVFSTDPEDLRALSLKEVRNRAYAFAVIPAICEKAQAFLEALSDPVKQLDEGALLACSEELELALLKSHPPVKIEEPVEVQDAPPPLLERESLRSRRKAEGRQ